MKNVKIYEKFKKKTDFILNFQLCKAYLNENCPVVTLVERILLQRYPNLWKEEKALIRETGGKHEAVIDLPRVGYKATVNETLGYFVELRFDKMITEVLNKKPNYPQKFRDIVDFFQEQQEQE